MKRAVELRSLSEDHHHGLVHARRLREAASGERCNLVETARTFMDFWQREASVHFRKEEEVLLPVLARHRGNLSQRPVVEMLTQHAQIRALVMELSDEVKDGQTQLETLRSIGERLEAHIRLEEREVFPMIEETFPEETLKEIASRLTVVKEAGPRAEPWVSTEGLSYDPWPGPGDSEGGGFDWPSRNPR